MADLGLRLLSSASKHHPDKLPSSIAQLDEDQALQVRPVSSIDFSTIGSPTIHQINEAYAVLSSDGKRHEYDRQLEIARRQRNTARTTATLPSRIVATLDLDTFHIEEEASQAGEEEGVLIFTYDCRCGDHYQLTGSEVLTAQQSGQEDMIVQCGGCSERIKVLLGGDDRQLEEEGEAG